MGYSKPSTIRDLVDVRPHPTVVRLEHLDAEDSAWISEAYYVTDDVKRHLRGLRHALAQEAGCGAFLIGQYGSGKSHFLAYVIQRLRERAFGEATPSPVAVSLVNFRAEMALEDVIASELGLDASARDRRAQWEDLAASRPQGTLLVIDELSEFLRSKPSAAAFNEDVRFLQFLGEWAQSHRFWVIAAMQESIEHTGKLDQGIYRKIKDRYPLRFLLSPQHVRDLLGECILVKRPGYAEAVGAVASDLQRAFPDFPIEPSRLASIYPMHTATLDLLEEVRDRFSQARGVVDFATTQLRGDERRGVRPFLDAPWGSLLSPDRIVDHFRDLLELQEEFQPLAQQVFPTLARQLEELFPTAPQRALAARVGNLLALAWLSPRREGITAKEAAWWLLHKATTLDPAKNIGAVRRVLETLATRGRYVGVKDGVYRLDLGDDGGAALERELAREKNELRARGDEVFDLIAAAEVPLELLRLPRDVWQPRVVQWHFHDRTVELCLGEPPSPPSGALGLCVRLPWGERDACSSVWTVVPASIEMRDEHVELAALLRLSERVSGAGQKAFDRFRRRLGECLEHFRSQVRSAYLEAAIVSPTGEKTPAPRVDPAGNARRWVEQTAAWILTRRYPSFERFAPTHGPLPRESYRRFFRFICDNDLGDPDADDHVKLIREAYLVPMKLLQRSGRGYAIPGNLEKHELVSLITPLLSSQPPPRVLAEHLSAPVYGLVPDQVALLLLVLLAIGEIDILKGRTSLRDSFETLPDPLAYDKVVPGCALAPEQLKRLETLCQGLDLSTPRQWSVLAQRRVAVKLRQLAASRVHELQALLVQLTALDQAAPLRERLAKVVSQWGALERGEDELESLRQFLFEIGSVGQFVTSARELQELPARLDKLLSELERFRHLLAHPVIATFDGGRTRARIEALGEPPTLDRPEAADEWLARARETWSDYKTRYDELHSDWWRACNGHALWTWRPPALAASPPVGLARELVELETCRTEATRLRCRQLVNLDFQPICHCEFDGEQSSITTVLTRFAELRERIERSLTAFFVQDGVRRRLRACRDDGLETSAGLRAYLAGKKDVPDGMDLGVLERCLSGMELVKQVDPAELLEILAERTWEPAALLDALRTALARYGNVHLRFTAVHRAKGGAPAELDAWCVEQALRRGVALPCGLGAGTREIAALVRREWVGPEALASLDELGLPDAVVDAIAGWIADGSIDVARDSRTSDVVAAARELRDPRDPRDAPELAALAGTLFAEHGRFVRLARTRWLARLDRLATTALRTAPPDLTEALRGHCDAQWLVIDCFGAPLVRLLRGPVGKLLHGWEEASIGYAFGPEGTTTDDAWRELVDAGFNQPLEKINRVDELVHGRFAPLVDFARLAEAELAVALRTVGRRLDTTRPLLVFADHGFRIDPHGRAYVHGGGSTLERLVPLIRYEPRR